MRVSRMTGISLLCLLSAFLAPSITHEPTLANALPEPKVYLTPPVARANVGALVAVNVSIADATDVYAWEVALKWDPYGVFNYTTTGFKINITEGGFLKAGGTTTLAKAIEGPPIGQLQVGCTLSLTETGVSGSGTLATISFQVREENSTILDLFDTKLYDSDLFEIPHTVEDGLFTSKPSVSSTLLLSVAPSSIEINRNFTLSGSINPVVVGATVTLKYRVAGGATWTPLATRTTNQTSQYTYQWKPISVGSYDVQASWVGNLTTLGDDSDVVTATVNKQGSTITLILTPSTVTIGSKVNMSGEITPKHSGVTVNLEYRLVGGIFNTLSSVTTDPSGQYRYSWEPPQPVIYEIQASWAGDDTTSGASSIGSVHVTTPETTGLDITLIGAAIIIIVIVVVAFLLIRRSRGSK